MTQVEIVLFTGLGLLLAVVLVLQVGTLRRIAPALERAERLLAADPMSPDSGLEVGSSVPDFSTLDLPGRTYQLADLLQGGEAIVLFASEGCPSCAHLERELRAEGWSETTPLVLVADTPVEWSSEAPGNMTVVYQVSESASKAFRQTSLPQAFVVSAERTVVGRIFPSGLEDLKVLVRTVAGSAVSDMPPRSVSSTP